MNGSGWSSQISIISANIKLPYLLIEGAAAASSSLAMELLVGSSRDADSGLDPATEDPDKREFSIKCLRCLVISGNRLTGD